MSANLILLIIQYFGLNVKYIFAVCSFLRGRFFLPKLKHWDSKTDYSLEGKRTRVGNGSRLDRNPISLGTELMEILHTFSTSDTDMPDYTVVEIDTTPFERGILHIEIQVGAGEAVGTFELFDADVEILTKEATDKALTGAWNVAPDSIGHIFHHFGQSQQHFKLVATGANNQKSNPNAFLARVSVIPPFEK